jgi:mRNA interferase RelE/StbE
LAWTIKYTGTAKNLLRKLDKQTARRIVNYMEERVAALDDPRSSGKNLTGLLGDLWRYRVGDYRVICEIQERVVCVLELKIGHRGKIYE